MYVCGFRREAEGGDEGLLLVSSLTVYALRLSFITVLHCNPVWWIKPYWTILNLELLHDVNTSKGISSSNTKASMLTIKRSLMSCSILPSLILGLISLLSLTLALTHAFFSRPICISSLFYSRHSTNIRDRLWTHFLCGCILFSSCQVLHMLQYM